jgi:8-oxo-dGTP diphosphatase
VTGDIAPQAEIDAMVWIDPAAPLDIPLAPLTRDQILPLAALGRRAPSG